MATWKPERLDLKLPGFNKKCKVTPTLKSQFELYSKKKTFNTLPYNTLNLIRKKKIFKPLSTFQKLKGIDNQIRVFYVFVNFHNVNIKPSIFDVIDRLNTTEHQIIIFYKMSPEGPKHIA